ncbi:MAG: hypothetical protein JWM41_3762 [Gemmatimonadetes bacterium]|nr:hypothetical protein [Gemmatimonadota bacterium]
MRNSILWSAVIVAAVTAPAAVSAQSSGIVTTPQIVTSGIGEARISPDRATIFIGVQSKAATAAAAGTENARRQRAILDTLKAMGLTNEQLSTVNYNVSPEMQYSPNGTTPPRVTGYTVSNTVRAEVRRLDDVGKIIDAALAKGANEISSLQFFSSKADSVRRVALSVAVMNARADAEVLARAAGGSLGQLLELSTSEPASRPVPIVMARMTEAKQSTPIEAGEQSFSASVSARWAFVGGR